MDFAGGISVFSRMEDGHIQHVENLDSYQFRFMIDQPFSIAISPDDKHLYAAGTSLFCFNRNPDSGKLTLNYEIKYEDLNVEIYRLNDITIGNDGKYLLAVSNVSAPANPTIDFALIDGSLPPKDYELWIRKVRCLPWWHSGGNQA